VKTLQPLATEKNSAKASPAPPKQSNPDNGKNKPAPPKQSEPPDGKKPPEEPGTKKPEPGPMKPKAPEPPKDKQPAPAKGNKIDIAKLPLSAIFDKVAAQLNGQDKPFTMVKELKDPDGTFKVGSIRDNTKVKLTGKIGKLMVSALDQNGVLDASALEAKEIVIVKRINGQATLLLNAPKGKVVFLAEIGGQTQVAVHAPNGEVSVGDPIKGYGPDQAQISGEAQVAITAGIVKLRGPINGSKPQVVVTLSKGGLLKFHEVSGSARLFYKSANPSDPGPTIEKGKILGNAELKKVE
jgi:hypothetical protein